MYESLGIIALTITFLTFILTYCINRRNPFRVFSTLKNNRQTYLHLGILAFILLINKLELKLESLLSGQTDYSSLFYSYEHTILPMIQSTFRHQLLTEITTFFYIIMFITLIATSVVTYLLQEDWKLFYTFLYAIGFNYIFAIPFYLLFPVNEAWYSHPQIEFFIPAVYPGFESQYRHMSGLDNCFPSLHNSISMTVLFVSSKSSSLALKSLTYISVPIIMFATIYLGIHWLTDMAAGILLAIIATKTALLIADKLILRGKRKKRAQDGSEHTHYIK